MEGKISMTARRQVTNKLRDGYRKATKADKTLILDKVMDTTGMGRSTARRLLTGPRLPDPGRQIDRRALKARGYSDEARELLKHVWSLMGFPCGKYLVVMLELWLPALQQAGDLNRPFATPEALAELQTMSAATVDRYLAPSRQAMALTGITTTTPGPLLRNSIGVRKAGDELDDVPGMIEADTVAHCGPTLKGEFARTLTMTDMATGWTEARSIRNNATSWITDAVERLHGSFPLTGFDSDNGSEFINHTVADWLQDRDIAFTRSRPYKKNDQATVESKNNHVVRKHAFYWRYDTGDELALLNQLWPLVSMRLNFFTPTKKPIAYSSTASGKRRRVYDKPCTPWHRVQSYGLLTITQAAAVEARVAGVNPADLTRRINTIQNQLTQLARDKTNTLAAARRLDMASLEPSITRLQPTK
jgi:hypothetical protein